MKKYLLSYFIAFNAITAQAQGWHPLGPAQNNQPTFNAIDDGSLAIDGNGTPYIAYQDGQTLKGIVRKFDGSSWVDVGPENFTSTLAYYTSIALDHSGTPYLAYSYGVLGGMNVMKYNGTAWVNINAGALTTQPAYYTNITISPQDTAYIAFEDFNNSGKATVMKYNGSNWATVGNPGFSTGLAYYTSIVVDSSGTPYVAFEDYGYDRKVTVMKYNGSNWVNVGTPGFSAGPVTQPTMAINGNGTPYVTYPDSAYNYGATVMEYNGSNWVSVGNPGFSPGRTTSTSIAIDSTGVPYVAFEDEANGDQATVMKYNGSNWVTVGAAGFALGDSNTISGDVSATVMALGPGNIPYILYAENADNSKGVLEKYTGGTWVNVGVTGFSPGMVSYPSLTSDAGGTLYAAFSDARDSSKASVMKYNGGAWALVGAQGFSAASILSPSIAIDGSGTPYVIYSDDAYNGEATVMKYNGSAWVNVGSPGISAGLARTLSIAIDPSGTPWVVFQDLGAGEVAVVMKYNGSSWVSAGAGVSAGIATSTSIAIDGGGTPYVVFLDNTNGNNATVKKYTGGAWQTVGTAGIPNTSSSYISMAIDTGGTPYLAFGSSSSTVMKFNGSNWVNVGNPGFAIASEYFISLAITADGKPYVAFQNGASYEKATVMGYNGQTWQNVAMPNFSSGAVSYTSLAAGPNGALSIVFADGSAWSYQNNNPVTLTADSITGLSYCPQATVTVPYLATGTYNAGNVFTAQLSNASGNFGSAVNIGTFTGTTNSGNITATIPAGALTGTYYRIRVVSSNPVDTGGDNGVNISIVQTEIPSVTISASLSTTCGGANDIFTAAPINGGVPAYQWYRNGTVVGGSSGTFNSSSLNRNDSVWTVMTSNLACASPSTATSNYIKVLATDSMVVDGQLTSTGTATNNGNITVSVSGGTPPYTYDWGGGVTTMNRSQIPSGFYRVNVTDSTGCGATHLFVLWYIWGNIYSWNSFHGIRGCTVNEGVNTVITDTTGYFDFMIMQSSYDTITPSKNNDSLRTNGVSVTDVLDVQRYLAGGNTLAEPMGLIAADVNSSGSINDTDWRMTEDLILGNITTFPGNRLWAFLPVSYNMPDLSHPWGFPQSNYYDSIATQHSSISQDFDGIKLGDVDGDWNPYLRSTPDTMQFYVPGGSVVQGSHSATIPVKAKGFSAISGFQFTLQWDAAVLTFAGLDTTQGALKVSYGATQDATGALNILWTAPNAGAFNVPDDSTLFYVKFNVAGNVGDSALLVIDSALIPLQVVDSNLNDMYAISQPGLIKVNPVTGINQPEKDFYVTVYPNPANTMLAVDLSASGADIVVNDVSGKGIFSKANLGSREIISTGNWADGLYLVTVSLAGITQNFKVVVLR